MLIISNSSSSSPTAAVAVAVASVPPQPEVSSPTLQNPHISFRPINRRHLITAFTLSVAVAAQSNLLTVPVAGARGLFQMPPVRLTNRYFLVRAGESAYESLGVINTNPVAKTSVDNGLSEIGKKQTVKAALELKTMGACEGGCWIWPSITQRAYQAAEIIASINGISRSYIVPEYSFLDARGLGAYEGKKLEYVSEFVGEAFDEGSYGSHSPDCANVVSSDWWVDYIFGIFLRKILERG